MKKFIFCVVTGYALVFTLFIGLPQMMGGRGGTLIPKGGAVPGVAESIQPLGAVADKAPQKAAVSSFQAPNPLQPAQDQKPFKPYKTGPVETFYRNGTLSSEWILDAAGGGVFKTYTPDGHPWMSLPVVNHVLEGELKIFYPEGPLFSSENYSAGERRGVMFWQYKNGNPWLKIAWGPDGKGLLESLYSEDGKRADLPVVRAEQGTSYFKAFDEYGHEVINLQQAGGEQNLTLKSYYQAGVLSAEIGLRGKSLHGRMARYYPDGTVWMEGEFSEQRSGAGTVFYPEKKVIASTEILLTAPQEGLEWTAYYPDEKIFWQLTKLVSQDHVPVFQLTTHWQDETPANTKKERVLL